MNLQFIRIFMETSVVKVGGMRDSRDGDCVRSVIATIVLLSK